MVTTLSSSGAGNVAAEGKNSNDAIDLEVAMKNMRLKDSELDDVFVGAGEILELAKSARWLALDRVNTRKPCNARAFKNTMKYAWRLANKPEFREVDDNMFVIQLFCLGDCNVLCIRDHGSSEG